MTHSRLQPGIHPKVPLGISRTDFSISEIAGGLARLPRWLGRARDPETGLPLSVALHSVWCVEALESAAACRCNPATLMATLMHDAHEAWLGDIPAQVKQDLGPLRIEAHLDRSIAVQVATEAGWPPHWKRDAEIALVDAADIAAAAAEANWFSGSGEHELRRRVSRRAFGCIRTEPHSVGDRLCELVRKCHRPDILDVGEAAESFLAAFARIGRAGWAVRAEQVHANGTRASAG